MALELEQLLRRLPKDVRLELRRLALDFDLYRQRGHTESEYIFFEYDVSNHPELLECPDELGYVICRKLEIPTEFLAPLFPSAFSDLQYQYVPYGGFDRSSGVFFTLVEQVFIVLEKLPRWAPAIEGRHRLFLWFEMLLLLAHRTSYPFLEEARPLPDGIRGFLPSTDLFRLSSAVLLRIASEQSSSEIPWDKPTLDRAEFIYEHEMKGTQRKLIKALVNQTGGWANIDSENGVKYWAKEYAKLKGLPSPEPRGNRRNK